MILDSRENHCGSQYDFASLHHMESEWFVTVIQSRRPNIEVLHFRKHVNIELRHQSDASVISITFLNFKSMYAHIRLYYIFTAC